MINDLFQKRFRELQEKSFSLPTQTTKFGDYVMPGTWQGWASSCQSLIKAVYGEESPHCRNFSDRLRACDGSVGSVDILKGIFASAREDFEGGYVFNVELKVSGEIFGDLVVLAKESLSGGYKDVAAVLATAALEDALKRYARANGLETQDRTMAQVINALKSKGLVSGASKSLLSPMPKIRNAALHAEWHEISETDVSSVLGFVEQFLLTNFSDN